LVLSGFQAVVVPSGFRIRVQPDRWMTRQQIHGLSRDRLLKPKTPE